MKVRFASLCICICLIAALVLLPGTLMREAGAIGSDDIEPSRTSPTAVKGRGALARSVISPTEANAASQAGLMPPDVKSVLAIHESLKHGQFTWDERGSPKGEVVVWVDLRRQLISVYRHGHEIGASTIGYGTDQHQTPLGSFEVISRHRHYRSKRYDAEMPYSLFITNDGIALHASQLHPNKATHGCIGLPEGFSRRLFQVAPTGTRVVITRSAREIAARLMKVGPIPSH